MKLLVLVLVVLIAGCASHAPTIDPQTLRDIQQIRSVHVKVEYWPGLQDYVQATLERELTHCSSAIAFSRSETDADATIVYFHLEAICLDCNTPLAPEGFELRLLRRNRELVRWKRINIGCVETDCMVEQAMRGVAKILCSR